ncbi:MAG: Xylose isomerase protein barrel [Frankiales bacterium]|jgi:sugar phosphate isomerase/epimerase|nr:Xylose isomerase protein barrel [Frankiales bacterium]
MPVPPDIGWVLWSGTVGLESPVPARIEAAQAAGFSRLSVSPLDVARAAEQGTPPRDLGQQIRGAGLEIVMDPVMNWYGGDPPAGSRFGRFSTEEALRMSEALEVVTMTAIGQPPAKARDVDVAEAFGVLCDRAADIGAQVHLEFIPMTEVADLATAWAIVQAADRANGGILFDTWHFFRGRPDYDVLRSVPGERIFAVQIDDALAEPRADLREDTLNRLLPGDGDFDLPRVVAELHRTGGLRWVGPEVISPVLAAMSPVGAAQLAGGRVRDLIAGVCGPDPQV